MIYFLQCQETGRIKIGYSASPSGVEDRLTNIRSASPTKIHLLGTMDGDMDLEKGLHSRFEPFRVMGANSREWYFPTEGLVRYLRKHGLSGSMVTPEIMEFQPALDRRRSRKNEAEPVVPADARIRIEDWVLERFSAACWVVGKAKKRKRRGRIVEELVRRKYPSSFSSACRAMEQAILFDYGPEAHLEAHAVLTAISEGKQEANVQLELITEQAKRDDALDRLDKAHDWWIRIAVSTIRRVAARQPDLTSADIWMRIQPEPDEPRAMGAAFRRAAEEGYIRKTGDYLPLGSRGRPISVWKSLLYEEAA